MVKTHSLKVRFLALFVTVFVCLNGAGAACVAYCQTMDAPEESADHCPLKKLSADCEPDGSFFSSHGGGFDCCPMTASFFAAPVEKSSFSIKHATADLPVQYGQFVTNFHSYTPIPSAMSYRGPPPLDRRSDRLKHRLLLI